MTGSTRPVFAAIAVAVVGAALLMKDTANSRFDSPATSRAGNRLSPAHATTRIADADARRPLVRAPAADASTGHASTTHAPDRDSASVTSGASSNESTLRHRFETATDYRALFDDLVRSGAPEGRFFAARIIAECQDVGASSFDEVLRGFVANLAADASTATRIGAFRRLKEPCAGFSRLDVRDIEPLLVDGARHGDLRAISQLLALDRLDPASDPMVVTTRLLDAGDPYIIVNVANFLFRNHGIDVMVDGAVVAAADRDAVQMAWDLVACDYGSPCGAASPPVLNICAHDGLCDAETFEGLIGAHFGILASFERVQHFRHRILEALGARNYASLGISMRQAR